MREYKNYVNWHIPEEVKTALRIKAAIANKSQQTVAVEILRRNLLEEKEEGGADKTAPDPHSEQS